MSMTDTAAYLKKREKHARKMALEARDFRIAAIHTEMADRYQSLCDLTPSAFKLYEVSIGIKDNAI